MNRLDLILVFSYSMGTLFVLAGVRGRLPGPKVGRLSAIPTLAGLALLGFLLWEFGGDTPELIQTAVRGPRFMVMAAGTAVGGGAVAHFLFTWCLDSARTVVAAVMPPRPDGVDRAWVAPSVLAAASTLLVSGLILVSSAESSAREEARIQVSVDGLLGGVYQLPGGPTDLVFVDATSGYVSLDIDFFTPQERSEIYRFEAPRDGSGELTLERVAEGLSFARGMALLRDTLYVTDQGDLPCDGVAFINCVQGLNLELGEPNTLKVTRGRVLAFPVNPDGSLGPSSVVIGDLPVINSEHSLQDLEVGPDGRLWLSIGGPGQLARDPALMSETERPNLDLVGTIVSFNTDGTDLEVFARGFRNVFQFAFDESGELFGAENDGPGARSWKMEEVLHIKRGANYGFPFEGTFDRGQVRTDPPIWIQNTVGSAGLEWAGRVGLAPGLFLGSEKQVAYLVLARDEFGYHVRSRGDITNLVTLSSGNVTVLKAGPADGQLWAGVYGLESKLLLLDFGQTESGGMLALTCTACHGGSLTGVAGLGPDLTQNGNLATWTEPDFITALRTGVRPDGTLLDAQRMPWLQFSELPEEELATLWDYLAADVRRGPGAR